MIIPVSNTERTVHLHDLYVPLFLSPSSETVNKPRGKKLPLEIRGARRA